MINITPDTRFHWTDGCWTAKPGVQPATPELQSPDFRFAALAKANEKLRQELKHAAEKDGATPPNVVAA